MADIYPATSITILNASDLDAPNQTEIVKLGKKGQYPIICCLQKKKILNMKTQIGSK